MSRLGGSYNQSNPNSRLGQLQFQGGLKPYEAYNQKILAAEVDKIDKNESSLSYKDKLNTIIEASKAGLINQADYKTRVDRLIAGQTADIYKQNEAPAWQRGVAGIGNVINEIAVKPITTAINTAGGALASGMYDIGRTVSGEKARLQNEIIKNDIAFKEAIKNAQKPLISPQAKAEYLRQAASYSNAAQRLRGQDVAQQQDVVQSMNPEKVGGALLTIAALGIPGGKVAQTVGRLATPATAKIAPWVGRAVEGAVTGGTFGVGTAMNEGKNLEEVLKTGLETAALGSVAELALKPLALFANTALKKAGTSIEEIVARLKGEKVEVPTPKIVTPEVGGRVNIPVTKVETGTTNLQSISDTSFAQQLSKLSAAYDKEITKIGKIDNKLTQQLAAKQLEAKYETAVNKLVDSYSTGKLVPTIPNRQTAVAPQEVAGPRLKRAETPITPIEPVPAIANVPTTPVTGQTKVSGSALKAEQRAIENKLVSQFENLATYQGISFKEEAQLAAELLKADRQQAIDIALGRVAARNDAQRAALAAGLEREAMKTGDTALLQDLANSPRLTKTSEAAQTLAAEGFFVDPTSPVAIIADLKNIRNKVAETRTKTSTAKLVKEESAKIDKSIKAPTKDEWSAFIEGLRC